MIDVGSMIEIQNAGWYVVDSATIGKDLAGLKCRKIAGPQPSLPIDVSKIEPGDWVRVEATKTPHPYIIEGEAYDYSDGYLLVGGKLIREQDGSLARGVKIHDHKPRPWTPPEGWREWHGVAIYGDLADHSPMAVFIHQGLGWWRDSGYGRILASDVEITFAGKRWQQVTLS